MIAACAWLDSVRVGFVDDVGGLAEVGRGSEVVVWGVVWGATSLGVHIEDSSCCIFDRSADTNVNGYYTKSLSIEK